MSAPSVVVPSDDVLRAGASGLFARLPRGAVRFDAAADQLTRTTGLPPIASFSILGWFRLASIIAFACPFSYGSNASTHYYEPFLNSAAKLEFYNGLSNVVGTRVLSTLTWYHLALTVAGTGAGQALAYLDGTLELTHAGDPTTTGAIMAIATSAGDLADDFPGRIAGVKVYSVALSAAEVRAEMRSPVPVRWRNLNAWYPLAHHSIARQDFSGQKNHLTVGGTLTTEAGPPFPLREYRRKRSFVAVGGGASYAFAAAGGIDTTGTAPVLRRRVAAATGGATTTGTAPVARGKLTTAAGGAVTSGAGAVARGKLTTAAGGLVTSGTSTPLRGRACVAGGGATTTGVASVLRGRALTATGTATTTGTALVRRGRVTVATGTGVFGGAGAFSTSGAQQFSFAATGGLTTTGVAPVRRGAVLAASGLASTAGAAAIRRGKLTTGSGIATTAGAASVARRRTCVAAGGALTSGAAPFLRRRTVMPTGTLTAGGVAVLVRTQQWIATGSAVVAGTAAFGLSVGPKFLVIVNQTFAEPQAASPLFTEPRTSGESFRQVASSGEAWRQPFSNNEGNQP